MVPEHALEDPLERAALVDAVTRETADVLARHRAGDRLRFPMPCFIGTGKRSEDPKGR